MKNTFVSLFAVALIVCGAASSQATGIFQSEDGEEVAVSTDHPGEPLQASPDFLYHDLTFNLASYSPGVSLSAADTPFRLVPFDGGTPAGVAGSLQLDGTRVSVPLPEPSSQTALYLLSGAVGLGFVVMRRRTAA